MKKFLGLLFIASVLTVGIAKAAPVTPDMKSEAAAYVVTYMQPRHDVAELMFILPSFVQNDDEFVRQIRHYSKHTVGSVQAFYGVATGTIYLKESFTKEDMPILVHEMVHAWQDFYGLPTDGHTYACSNEMEREAYTLQNRYAHEHDASKHFVAPEAIERISRCR